MRVCYWCKCEIDNTRAYDSLKSCDLQEWFADSPCTPCIHQSMIFQSERFTDETCAGECAGFRGHFCRGVSVA